MLKQRQDLSSIGLKTRQLYTKVVKHVNKGIN